MMTKDLENPTEQLKMWLTHAQTAWQQALDVNKTTYLEDTRQAVNCFSAAWYLSALIGGVPAEEAASDLCEILNDGGEIGERIYTMLTGLGIDQTPAAFSEEDYL